MLAHPLLRHFAISAALVLLALLVTMLFWPLCQWYPAAFFLAALLIAAWRWELWQGISTGSAALLPLLFVYRSAGGDAAPMAWGEVAWRLGLFVLVGGLASYLTLLCRRALGALDSFNGTLAAVNDALIFTDAAGNVRHMNSIAESITGYTLEGASDQPLERILKCVHGDARQPVQIPITKVACEGGTFELPPDTVLLKDLARETNLEGRAVPYRDDVNGSNGMAVAFRDVTRRRQEERECRKREEQFRTLASCAPVGLLLLDTQGRCVYANPAWQSAGGLGFGESDGEGWAKAVHADDRGRLVTEWSHALRAGREFVGECRLQPRRCEPRWMRLSSAPMLSESGKLLGHIGVFEDMDARKQAELSLRESENRFTAVMRNFPGLAFLKDPQARYTYANDAFAQLFGWEPDDWEGKTDRDLLPRGETNPFCDQEGPVREHHEDHEGVATASFEGRERTFLVRQFAVPGGSDQDFCFGGVAIDITDQHEAEQALRAAREEFERKWNERAGDLKRSEEAMRKARTDLERHVSESAARQKQADEALRAARQELEQSRRQLEEQSASRRKSEEALKAATELLDEQAADQDRALRALRVELDEKTQEVEPLRKQLEGHAECAGRIEELEQENGALADKLKELADARIAERDALFQDQRELTTANETLRDQVAALETECEALRRGMSRGPERRPTPIPAAVAVPDAASEAETHQILVHSWRLVENMESWRARELPADWLSYN